MKSKVISINSQAFLTPLDRGKLLSKSSSAENERTKTVRSVGEEVADGLWKSLYSWLRKTISLSSTCRMADTLFRVALQVSSISRVIIGIRPENCETGIIVGWGPWAWALLSYIHTKLWLMLKDSGKETLWRVQHHIFSTVGLLPELNYIDGFLVVESK